MYLYHDIYFIFFQQKSLIVLSEQIFSHDLCFKGLETRECPKSEKNFHQGRYNKISMKNFNIELSLYLFVKWHTKIKKEKENYDEHAI